MDVDPITEAGRAWMSGELDSRDYFAMVRREARRATWQPRRRSGLWSRLRVWWSASR